MTISIIKCNHLCVFNILFVFINKGSSHEVEPTLNFESFHVVPMFWCIFTLETGSQGDLGTHFLEYYKYRTEGNPVSSVAEEALRSPQCTE